MGKKFIPKKSKDAGKGANFGKKYAEGVLDKAVASGLITKGAKDAFERRTASSNSYKAKGSAKTQDISWYNKFPTLLGSVANKAWSWIAGTPLAVDPQGVTGLHSLTGVVKIGYVPCIGHTLRNSQPAFMAAHNLWLAMHRKYRGIGTYESADVGITLECIINFFTELARAQRIYGVCYYYDVLNRNIPKALYEAMNLQVTGSDSILKNLANFRAELNRLIIKAKQLCLPIGMSVLSRRLAMNSKIFKDSDSPRALLYFFEPDALMVFDGSLINTGSAGLLINRTVNSNEKYDVNTIITDLEFQLDHLLDDTDVTKMCSDMLAAIGDNVADTSELVRLQVIEEQYAVQPEYSFEWLKQVHNLVPFYVSRNSGTGYKWYQPCLAAMPYGHSSVAKSSGTADYFSQRGVGMIYQDGNRMYNGIVTVWGISDPYKYQGVSEIVAGSTSTSPTDPAFNLIGASLVDTDIVNPGIEEITELTRDIAYAARAQFTHTPSGGSATTYYNVQPLVSGSELFGNLQAFKTNPSNQSAVTRTPVVFFSSNPGSYLATLTVLREWDWGPHYYIYQGPAGPTTATYQFQSIVCELDNPVVFTVAEIDAINQAALLSEYVTDFAKATLSE